MAYGCTATVAPVITGSHSGMVCVLVTANFPTAAVDGGANSILNGGGNLRAYTDSSKTTRLPVEVVTFVTGGSPQVEVWVRCSSVLTSSSIYIEADAVETVQPVVTDTYGRNAVWQDYLSVYHGKDLVDSTGSQDLTVFGAVTAGNLSGPLGHCFDGFAADVNNYLRSSGQNLASLPVMMQGFIKPASDTDTGQGIITFRNANSATDQRAYLSYQDNTTGNPSRCNMNRSDTGGSNNAYSTAPTVGMWNLLHAVVDGSGYPSVYLDGTDKVSNSDSVITLSEALTYVYIGQARIGRTATGFSSIQPANGPIAEVRLRASIPADVDNWIATEGANLSDPASFWSVSAWSEGGGGVTLAIAGAAHGHAAESPTLTLAGILSVAESLHAHAADNIDLTQANTIVVSEATHAHSADGITLSAVGVITLPAMKNNTGTVNASDTGITVDVYSIATGALIERFTGETTDASGICTISSANLTPGTSYVVVVRRSTNAIGLAEVAAA